MKHSKVNLHLSKNDVNRLDDIANLVFSSTNANDALEDLQKIQDASTQKAVKTLQNALNNDVSNVKGKDGVFSLLTKLASKGKQPVINYLKHYPMLDEAKNQIKLASRYNWVSIFYFILICLVFIIVITIYQVKVLPVFHDMFQSMNAQLPTLTEEVINGNSFHTMISITIFVIIFFGGILPFLFKSAISKMTLLPKYFIIYPSYLLTASLYHQLLFVIYTRIYSKAGEDNPIELAKGFFPKTHINIKKTDFELLLIAHKHNDQETFEKNLLLKEQKLIQKIQSRIKIAETITKFIIFILFARMLSVPIIAMYLPIFQFGSII